MKQITHFSPLLLAVALSPAFFQTSFSCERGDTYLLELELEAYAQNRLSTFNINNREYSLYTGSPTLNLTALARDAGSQVTYELVVDGAVTEVGDIGTGGGTAVVNVPTGPALLRVAVRAAPPDTLVGIYFVELNPPCTPGPGACDDENACTSEVCNPDTTCTFTNFSDGDQCDFSAPGDGVCAAVKCDLACGNGDVNPWEICDDGVQNGTGEGFCISDCTAVQSCGDATSNGTETCDDGVQNGAGEGFCVADCSAVQVCGDGVQNGTEPCDGGPSDTMTCNADCTVATCGDGYLNTAAGEACDDGNTVDGDGCSATCMVTPIACGLDLAACTPTEGCYPTATGAFCLEAGTVPEDDPCVSQNDCGVGFGCIDRAVGPPGALCTELCDEANGFFCSSGGPCTPIAGTPSGFGACDYDPCDPLDVSTCGPALACYPTSAGDLCLDAGSTPAGGSCTVHTDCVAGTWCVGAPGSEICMVLCDPANGDADCTLGEACTPLTSDPNIGACAPGCGNGVLNAGEACDDGANNGTGEGFCLSDCSGTQTCGDGSTNGTEVCDDGANNGTGEGFCISDCSATQICGDTIENGTEECDEGPADTMACNADCTVSACGDGYLNAAAGEVCDDGNTQDGDGCSSTCMPQAACGLDLAACLPTEGCYPTATAAGAYCYTAGTGVEDDPCVNQFDCAPGLGCINRLYGPPGSFCTELCDPANGFNCADGGPCSDIGSPSGIGACDPDACDPLDVSTCNAGLACYPTTAGDLCLDAGTTPIGGACTTHPDCVAGSWCVDPGSGTICMELCATANGNADCPAAQSCFALGSNPDIGVCF